MNYILTKFDDKLMKSVVTVSVLSRREDIKFFVEQMHAYGMQ
jgi:hypothetical protein